MIKEFKNKEEVYKYQRYLSHSQPKLKLSSLSYREKLSNEETKPEKHFRSILDDGGYNYEAQYLILTKGQFFIADFYLPDYHLIIELDGAHHFTDEGKLKDQNRDQIFRELGYPNIKRISNYDAMRFTIPSLNLLLSTY